MARRYKTPVGEIDLVALKAAGRLDRGEATQERGGRRLDAAGQAAAAHHQGRAILLSGHPDYAGHDIAFDVVLAAPWAWPRYIENAFSVA